MGSLTGQQVLVTGGASGIGAACAQRFADEGATVHVADISPADTSHHRLDVSDAAAWTALVATLPPLDIVMLNAGITTPGRTQGDPSVVPLSDISDDAYRAIVGVNLDGVFFGARAVLPGMAERRSGQILVTASMAGLSGMPGDVAYTTTKHAVVGMVRSLGRSLDSFGVCISAICPGFVDTPLVPNDAQQLLRGMGLPILDASEVADAAMHAVQQRINGSQWMVWAGKPVTRFPDPELGVL